MRHLRLILFALGVVGCLVPVGVFAFPDVTNPPAGWQVVKRIEVPVDQLPRFAQKFGCDVRSIDNTILENDGSRVQINLIHCLDQSCAEAVCALIVQAHGGDNRLCLRDGDAVVEFVGKDMAFVLRSRSDLGFVSDKVAYDVDFDAAPLTDGMCSEWNDLFQSALSVRAGAENATARSRLATLSKDFSFGSILCLARSSPGGHRIEYVTRPAAVDTGGVDPTGSICLNVVNPPRWEGLPSVHVHARVTVSAHATTPGNAEAARGLTRSTKWWPSDDTEVQQLAKRITEGAGNEREKLDKLLGWMSPGANLQYGGDAEGSRYGVGQVLKQAHGHCWDFSDVFVSLCRASALPARQVGGWLIGRSGHVWAEVYLQGQGWLAVDPTAGSACDAEYVPLWISEDGMIPFVYLSTPEIRKVVS